MISLYTKSLEVLSFPSSLLLMNTLALWSFRDPRGTRVPLSSANNVEREHLALKREPFARSIHSTFYLNYFNYTATLNHISFDTIYWNTLILMFKAVFLFVIMTSFHSKTDNYDDLFFNNFYGDWARAEVREARVHAHRALRALASSMVDKFYIPLYGQHLFQCSRVFSSSYSETEYLHNDILLFLQKHSW